MAKVDEDLDLDVQGGKGKGGGKMKTIIIFSVIGVLLIGFSITLTILLLGGNEPAPVPGAPVAQAPAAAQQAAAPQAAAAAPAGTVPGTSDTAYMDLNPAFVVNLDGTESDIRYLQVSVSVMVAKEADLETVKKHMPVLRHNLNLLFSSLDFNEIRSREGKGKLTDEALKVIRDALQKSTGSPVVQAVFFNSIVGQ